MSKDKKCKCEAPDQAAHKEIIQRLKAGNERYLRRELKCFYQKDRNPCHEGQAPYAGIISCADSRVIPEKVFDAGPGELFVTRVAGNIATDEIIASLDYAINVLGTQVIVVLGHKGCGAVESAIKYVKDTPADGIMISPLVSNLLQQIVPAVLIEGAESPKKDIIVKNAKLAGIQVKSRYKKPKKGKVQVYYAYYSCDKKVKFYHDLVKSEVTQ